MSGKGNGTEKTLTHFLCGFVLRRAFSTPFAKWSDNWTEKKFTAFGAESSEERAS